MDDVDRAQAQEQRWQEQALAQQRQFRPQPVNRATRCLNCDEHLPPVVADQPPLRWCDADCRDDWNKRQRL